MSINNRLQVRKRLDHMCYIISYQHVVMTGLLRYILIFGDKKTPDVFQFSLNTIRAVDL